MPLITTLYATHVSASAGGLPERTGAATHHFCGSLTRSPLRSSRLAVMFSTWVVGVSILRAAQYAAHFDSL